MILADRIHVGLWMLSEFSMSESIFDIDKRGLALCPWPITVHETARLEGFLNKFQRVTTEQICNGQKT